VVCGRSRFSYATRAEGLEGAGKIEQRGCTSIAERELVRRGRSERRQQGE
jgi:hypothetical protein